MTPTTAGGESSSLRKAAGEGATADEPRTNDEVPPPLRHFANIQPVLELA